MKMLKNKKINKERAIAINAKILIASSLLASVAPTVPTMSIYATDVQATEVEKDINVGAAENLTTNDVGTAGTGGSSSATLSLIPSQLSVTVPMSLPIHLAANGTVTTANDAKIVNNSIGRVKVTDVAINGANGWGVIKYDSDISTYQVNDKKVGFELNGIKTGDAGLTFDETSFPSMSGKSELTDSDEMKLDYSAVVTPQANVLSGQEVAEVVFTIDWDSSLVSNPHMTAEEATDFGYTYELLANDTYSLTGMPTTVENIEFPSTIDGKAVTKLGFEYGGGTNRIQNTTLKTVIIPDSVTSIGTSAFSDCYRFSSVTISNSVTSIGSDSFSNCTSLAPTIIPNSVTSIGSGAFRQVSHIAYTGTAPGAPWGSIYINLPLEEKDGLTYGYLSSNNGYILIHAKKDIITANILPDFNGTPVAAIGPYAFRYCTSLSSATIPESVTYIGEQSFALCYSLTSVTIPNSVTTFRRYPFGGVPNINYTGTDTGAPWGASNMNLTDISEKDGLIYGYSSSLNGYILISAERNIVTAKIPATHNEKPVVKIGDYALAECSNLKTISIPDNVTSIGNNAFYNCTNLTSVIMGNGVTSIGADAFSYCSSLESVIIPDSVINIGNSAFYRCTSLASVTIGNGVTSIGDLAFYYCSSLTSVIIPDSVTSIGTDAFWQCTKLTSVTIGSSVATMGDNAFYGCTSLTSVTIKNGATSIGESTFEDCTSLTSITIPISITTIDGYTFRGCTSLTSVIIPDSVIEIGRSAFDGCTGLTSVAVPSTVTSIGDDAFLDVPHITYTGTATGAPWGALSIN